MTTPIRSPKKIKDKKEHIRFLLTTNPNKTKRKGKKECLPLFMQVGFYFKFCYAIEEDGLECLYS
jgi:hypothetical protein